MSDIDSDIDSDADAVITDEETLRPPSIRRRAAARLLLALSWLGRHRLRRRGRAAAGPHVLRRAVGRVQAAGVGGVALLLLGLLL